MNACKLIASIVIISMSLSASAATGVSINGVDISPLKLISLQQQLNTYIAPGDYLYDPQSGHWVNRTTGASGFLNSMTSGGSPADRWVSPEELTHGGLRGVRPGILSTYDFIR